jgi:hypothetical protein
MTYLGLANPFELSFLELAERNEYFNNFPRDCRECRQPLRQGELLCHALSLGGCEQYRLEHYKQLLAESLPIHEEMQRVCICGHDRYRHEDATDECDLCRECNSFEFHAESCTCRECMKAEEERNILAGFAQERV